MSKSIFNLSDGEPVRVETREAPKKAETEIEQQVIQKYIEDVRADVLANNVYLPTLPTLALEALLVINDAGSSAADLEKVISNDTALAARLIRYANSPLYRGITPVTAIKLAIIRIGLQRVKNAVYAVSMKEVFRSSIKAIENRMEELWTHSVKVGAQAAILAKDHRNLDPDIALVAGLVHDIGYIPLLIKACDYPELVANTEQLDKLLLKLHQQVGGAITKMWQFDNAIVAVAGEHENFTRNPSGAMVDYVDIVQVANILAHENSNHPLASIDRRQIKAFERVKLNKDAASLAEDSKAVEDVVF